MLTKILNLLKKIMVYNELVRVSDWLNANKLTLNAKKSNLLSFVLTNVRWTIRSIF